MSEVDEKLDALERRISAVYAQAVEEVQEKLDNYLAQFKALDEKERKRLEKGDITQKQYDQWKADMALSGKQWSDMRDALAADLSNANRMAAAMVKGELPDVYAMGHNFAAYQIENDTEMDLSFTLYDRRTVERLLEDEQDMLPEPRVDIPKDRRWNRQHIQSAVLQGILQGEPMDKIARRLKAVTDMNEAAAMRNARTSVTGAENAGRVDSYAHAQDMGIDLEQEWLATLDGRTRNSHRHLDGERVKVGGKFSNGLRFPGDPQGAPWETYNCRCTLVAAIKGVDQSNAPRNSKLGDMSYEEWKGTHSSSRAEYEERERKIANAKTVDEIIEIMSGNGWFRTYEQSRFENRVKIRYMAEDSPSFLGFSVESARHVASAYNNFFERYPQLKGRYMAPTQSGFALPENAFGGTQLNYYGQVMLNERQFKKWGNVEKRVIQLSKEGYSPPTNTAESVIYHELGHVVDLALTEEGILGGDYEAKKYTSSVLIDKVMDSCGLTRNDIHRTVGEYATSNEQEWFAECFAEYMTSDSPRQVAKEFGRQLEELLKGVKKK